MKRSGPIARKTPLRAKAPTHQRALSGLSTKPKRKPKTPAGKAKALADALWPRIIKDRDNWTCRRCGEQHRDQSMQAAHILGRGYMQTRHGLLNRRNEDYLSELPLMNGVALCFKCHAYFTAASAEWTLWIADQLGGASIYMYLNGAAVDRRFRVDYAAVLERLKERYPAQWAGLR